jgi:arsenate reductase (thioredoxin)
MSPETAIVFLGAAGSARTAMAAGLARRLLGDRIVVASEARGSSPVDPHALEVMREIGVDLGSVGSATLASVDPATVAVVITLGEEELCPAPLANARQLRWAIAEPASDDPTLPPAARLARFRAAREQLQGRLEVLAALSDLPEGPQPAELHASVRVSDLARSARFYAWLLGAPPKEWTHRYATFVRPELHTNFVIVVSDGKELHHDTLYHLGIGVADKAAVVRAHVLAVAAGVSVKKPPRTTWRGTPLHELWLEDPDGNLVEIYARLTSEELASRPADLEPTALT